MKAKITVIGSYLVDFTSYTDRFPSDGEAVYASSIRISHGGKGSNQAVAAHRAGADVTLILKLGCDTYGDKAVEFYKNEGIDTRFISRTDKAPTGMTSITVNTVTGENRMVLLPGANEHLSVSDIYAAEKEISESKIILMQNETNTECLSCALTLAKKHGVTVVFDPAPAKDIPPKLLYSADFITPNRAEAEYYSSMKVSNEAEAERASKFFMLKGVKNIITTLGEQGSLYFGYYGYLPTKAVKTDAVDTTGAGDSFNGAFCTAFAEGMDIEDALEFANTAASLCVMRKGAADAMPYRSEILTRKLVYYPK